MRPNLSFYKARFQQNSGIKMNSQARCAQQSGSALVVALFIIIFMAVLFAGIMRLLNVGATNTAYETVGLKAFLAAQSGINVGLSRFYPLNSTLGTSCASVLSSAVILPNTPDFANCSVTLSCDEYTSVVESTRNMVTITSLGNCSTGSSGNSGSFVTTRQIAVEAVQ